MTTTEKNLVAYVASECSTIDREERFDEMLDDCYSFEKVGGPFSNMSPSSVLKEVDPTAYRCGVNDYADGEDWVEIDGNYYESDDVEKAREQFVSDLESEVSDLESELEDTSEDDLSAIRAISSHISDLRAEITAAEKFSF